MKKRVFSFENEKKFRDDLLSLKNTDEFAKASSFFFQIHSSVLDENMLKPVWQTIEDVFPGVPWFGNSTSGNIVDCVVGPEISVSVTFFRSKSTKIQVFQYDMAVKSIAEISLDIVEQSRKNPWVKGVEIYHTIANHSTTRLCEGLDDLRSDIQVFGGIVCSPDITSPNSCVFSCVGGYSRTSLLVVFYGGNDFFIHSIKISGWKPLGRTFHVTKAEGSRLYELSGVPAYEIYRKYLNIGNDENFFYNALEFPMLYEHNGVSIVRAPGASNPDGSLSMSSDVDVGSIIRLSYGEPLTIVDCIREESARIKQFCPEILHVFSCAARKAFWSLYEPTYEIYSLKDVAASTGFFSHGEFLRENGHLNQHNITLVIAAMREGEKSLAESSLDLSSENKGPSKLPLAARMATFIKETSFELEQINSKLQVMNRQLQNIATTDSLTGLENRLAYDDMLEKISKDDVSNDWVMLIIDVNGLKYTNDTFGHTAGDALIIAAANSISEAFSSKGNCFRIGGDEFVVLVKASLDAMYKLRRDLTKAIDNYNKTGVYRLSMAVGESRLKTDLGQRKSISDWKLEADLNMYRDKANAHRSRASQELSENQNLKELISCMISIEEAKDSYTAHHSDRVCELSEMITRFLGLSENTVQLITNAAQLHDIGKVGISDAILGKPAKLTDEEFTVIKQHPVIGARILMQSNYTQELVQIVLHHHERFDGRGYPEGLAKEDIPVGARILAIADSIDAMMSRRVYRDAMSIETCRSEIEKNLGAMYDPAIGNVVLDHWGEIVDTMLRLLSGSEKQCKT